MNDAVRMPFGKYRGYQLDAIPGDYLGWLTTIELRPRLRAAVDAEVARRRGGGCLASTAVPAELREIAIRILQTGFRSLARRLHPDDGSDLVHCRPNCGPSSLGP